MKSTRVRVPEVLRGRWKWYTSWAINLSTSACAELKTLLNMQRQLQLLLCYNSTRTPKGDKSLATFKFNLKPQKCKKGCVLTPLGWSDNIRCHPQTLPYHHDSHTLTSLHEQMQMSSKNKLQIENIVASVNSNHKLLYIMYNLVTGQESLQLLAWTSSGNGKLSNQSVFVLPVSNPFCHIF